MKQRLRRFDLREVRGRTSSTARPVISEDVKEAQKGLRFL